MAQSILVAAKSKAAEFHPKHIISDRSVFHNNNAACREIIRDHHSRFLAGFSANLGLCTITVAELLGVFFGLKIAHLIGKDKVVLEALPCAQLIVRCATLPSKSYWFSLL